MNVLANDTDVDGDTLTVTTLTPTAAHGTVACTAGGRLHLHARAGLHRARLVHYTISDGHGGTDTATVSVTVTPVNDTPPVADDDTLTTAEDTSGLGERPRPTTRDADGDPLTVTSPTRPRAHGTVACTPAGTCTYTPSANYNGPDSVHLHGLGRPRRHGHGHRQRSRSRR